MSLTEGVFRAEQDEKEINMIKKHLKPTKENKGGIISKESFIHQSNVKNIDQKKTNKQKAGNK